MTARIYRPAPNAMQSGRGKSKEWVLIHEQAAPRSIEPLMGYTSTTDTRAQIKLTFDTLEEAESYAQRNGIPYQVMPEHRPSVKRASYADNFRSDRKSSWTH
ncbi:ETC complex I subunit [Devosia sp.]|uniref:ETC complex I subunit n=1 Tax=Devosia sp. TaxID=1871048 RepID=UPI003A8D7A34